MASFSIIEFQRLLVGSGISTASFFVTESLRLHPWLRNLYDFIFGYGITTTPFSAESKAAVESRTTRRTT